MGQRRHSRQREQHEQIHRGQNTSAFGAMTGAVLVEPSRMGGLCTRAHAEAPGNEAKWPESLQRRTGEKRP